MDRSTNFWKTKWKNVKELSRKREQFVKKQSTTGAGGLTKIQLKVIESQQYLDLANKLGKSAKGCDTRLDSDSTNAVEPPTNRLRKALSAQKKSQGNLQPGKFFAHYIFFG